MKALRLIWHVSLLFFGAAAVQLSARQADGTRKLIEELKRKAEGGDASAQIALGKTYWGTNFADADKWFRKAAAQGSVEAQRHLGILYQLRAAEADMKVQSAGGDLRLRDKSPQTLRDYIEAAKWFREAAEQGEPDAQSSLGAFYRDGKGVTQDYREAVKWMRRSANQGNFVGQLNLADCYEKGKGVPQDFIEAYKWYNLASAENGIGSSSRDELTQKMTAEQIAEAQRRSSAFIAKRELLTPKNSKNSSDEFDPIATGTGFFITDDGFLITNEHVVKEAAQVRLVTSAGIVAAKVVKVDAANDLALFKAEGRFAALPVVASRAMRLGSTVATVGFPNVGLQGFAPKLARGEVAALSGAQDDARHFQISVPVQPGNSGGALVDERGNVVGVVSAKLSARAALAASGALPENVNYAVKSSFLLSFLESVPEVSAKLKEANTKERRFEDVVKSAEQAAVLVLVY